MNKNEIQKIHSFINEVINPPDEILTSDDIKTFIAATSNEYDRKRIYTKEDQLFENVRDLKIRLIAYFRAVNGENSTYVELLGDITFRPKLFIFNTIHFKNNKAWLDDKITLLNLLKMAKTEFEEIARITKQNPESSFIHYFKTKEAKGIFLTAILAIVIGIVTKDIWVDKFFPKLNSIKTVMSKADSLVSADKKTVVDKAAKEVFTNYSQTIKSLEKDYIPINAMGYIDEYLKKEIPNIEKRILNKSYINRFASNENLWKDIDLEEVATLIRARTIIRIKEISEDIESKAQGPYIIADDKLRLLYEQVKTEAEE
jgi:hypothetical protein